MEKISDLSKIINGLKTTKNNTIYDEIKSKEKDMKEVIDRVLEYDKEQAKKREFLQTPLMTIIINTTSPSIKIDTRWRTFSNQFQELIPTHFLAKFAGRG